MTRAGYGRIINVLSTSVREPIPNLGVSNLTRAAVASWAKTLSRELPPGITINNILPGFTATDRLASSDGRATKWDHNRRSVRTMIAQVPEGRLGQPEELAMPSPSRVTRWRVYPWNHIARRWRAPQKHPGLSCNAISFLVSVRRQSWSHPRRSDYVS